MTQAENEGVLGRLWRRGAIQKDKHGRYRLNVEQGCKDHVRQIPTIKPDSKSKHPNPIIIGALKKKYDVINTCYTKRGGRVCGRVYNIVGIAHGFFLLRCPVTGGVFGRSSGNIEMVS